MKGHICVGGKKVDGCLAARKEGVIGNDLK